MQLFQLDPVCDDRWHRLVACHPFASVFHSVEWLKTLRDTYGYKPVAYTTSSSTEELANAVVFCDIRSVLTGKRLVSLPFSDHCAPLVTSEKELRTIIQGLQSEQHGGLWKYVELRVPEAIPVQETTSLRRCDSLALHVISLERDIDQIVSEMHKSSVRDRVRRAKREGVTCLCGRSESLIRTFYQLLITTRRRHGVPPQPFAWFRNLLRLFGNNLDIYVASKDREPIASILTLSFNRTRVYKYGCSDSRFHNLGGMPFLLWTSIHDAKSNGMVKYDMGRTTLDNVSLMDFKERLGATRTVLNYYRCPAGMHNNPNSLARRSLEKLVQGSPDLVLRYLGDLLYRHVG